MQKQKNFRNVFLLENHNFLNLPYLVVSVYLSWALDPLLFNITFCLTVVTKLKQPDKQRAKVFGW